MKHPGVGKGPFSGREGSGARALCSWPSGLSGPRFQSVGLASMGITCLAVWEQGGFPLVQVSFCLRLVGVIELGFLQPCPRPQRGAWAPVPQAPQAPCPPLWGPQKEAGILGGPLGYRVRPLSGPGSLVQGQLLPPTPRDTWGLGCRRGSTMRTCTWATDAVSLS